MAKKMNEENNDLIKDFSNSMKDIIREMEELTQKLNGISNNAVNSFNEIVVSNQNIANSYAEIVDGLSLCNEAIQKLNENLERTKESQNISNEEMLALLEKQKELQQEINELLNEKKNNANEDDKTDNQIGNKNEEIELLRSISESLKGIVIQQKTYNNKIDDLNDIIDDGHTSNSGKKRRKKDKRWSVKKKTELEQQLNWKDKALSFGVNLGKMGWDKLIEIDQLTRNFGRNFGMTVQEMDAHRTHITNNWGEMASSLGMTTQEMYKFQEGYVEATERAILLTDKQVGSFAALSRTVGETAISETQRNLDTLATSADASISYLGKGQARAALEGLHLKKYSEAFAKNIRMAAKYTFKEGITGVQKMTALAQRLKFDMQSIGNAMEKFSSIESAIETSAKIQVLGGSFTQNFGNPLEAMSEALMDAEGFTERIVKSVGQLAKFDRQTGEINLSIEDKLRLNEYANALGMNYDDAFNMATQSRKALDIEAYTRGKFDESQISYLANKAQWNTQMQEWQITDANGKQRNIQDISGEELDKIREKDKNAELLNSNVYAIKEFLIGDGIEKKSLQENIQGYIESFKLEVASWFNKIYGVISHIAPLLAIGSTLSSLGAMPSTGSLASSMRGAKKGLVHTASKGGVRGGLAKGILNGSKWLGKGASVIGKVGGSVLAVGMAAMEGYNAYKNYENQESTIKNAKNISVDEKAQHLNEAKRERNKGYGSAAGGLAGATLGASIGSVVPVVGTIIGGAIGYMAGSYFGSSIGDVVTESVEDTKQELIGEESKEQEKQNEDSVKKETVATAKATNRDVHKIGVAVEKLVARSNGEIVTSPVTSNYTSSTNKRTNIYTASNDVSKQSVMKMGDMKINLGGNIKLMGDFNQGVEINKLIDNPDFRRGVINIVSTAIERNSNGGVSAHKTSVS